MANPKWSYLGIDIGTASIKLVELADSSGVPELATYGLAEFPLDSKGRSAKISPDEIAATIRELVKQSKVRTKKTYSALPSHEIFTSILSFPILKKKELQEAIRREAESVLPLPIDQMVLDPQVLEESSAKGETRILLVAAPKSVVSNYDIIFKKAGLNLLGLETEGFALIRSLVGKDPSSMVVVDFGASATDIIVIDKTIPFMSRSINVGGSDITAAFVHRLGISAEEVEQLKRDTGLNGSNSTIVNMDVFTVALTPMINEIRHTISSFQQQTGGRVEKIILTGGSATLSGLTDYIAGIFKVRVYIGDPWARVRYPIELKGILSETAGRYGVAIGLAMRTIK